jgi:RalA-binding protein 1
LLDPKDRVTELSQLVASLPIANYTLLRALSAHLINIVQNNAVNKMNIRNMGIVFSPTLQIPAGIFSLMLSDFKQVFNVDAPESESDTTSITDADSFIAELNPGEGKAGNRPLQQQQQERVNKRNSMLYAHASADQMLGLEGRQLESADFPYLLVLKPVVDESLF